MADKAEQSPQMEEPVASHTEGGEEVNEEVRDFRPGLDSCHSISAIAPSHEAVALNRFHLEFTLTI